MPVVDRPAPGARGDRRGRGRGARLRGDRAHPRPAPDLARGGGRGRALAARAHGRARAPGGRALVPRRHELDDDLLRRAHDVLRAALADGEPRTKAELADALAAAGIPAPAQRMGHLAMHAELEGLITSGPRRGARHTHVLLDDRLRGVRERRPADPVAELARRYVTSHGPATARDFAWWSGLTLTDARAGLERVRPALGRRARRGRHGLVRGAGPGVPRRARPSPPRRRAPRRDVRREHDRLPGPPRRRRRGRRAERAARAADPARRRHRRHLAADARPRRRSRSRRPSWATSARAEPARWRPRPRGWGASWGWTRGS